MSSRQAHVHIDLDAIAANFQLVQERAPNSQVMAVVKADAYGHGAVQVAKKLNDASCFGVARVSEAVKLREAGVGAPICLLEGVNDKEELNLASIYELQIVVHDKWQLELLKREGARRQIWIKVDTGMGRLGIRPESLTELLTQLGSQTLIGLMTHLANADDPHHAQTAKQVKTIESLRSDLPVGTPISIAASAGVLAHPQTHEDYVRPGLMLYGASPMIDSKALPELHPAMTLTAPVIAVREIKAGESVGYGGIWTADQDSRVAVVAAGYGDGYPRETAQHTPVLIAGLQRPLVGRVSMDMISVKLEAEDKVQVGDKAVLWGDGLAIEKIASHANTLAYTLMSGVAPRVARIYRGT